MQVPGRHAPRSASGTAAPRAGLPPPERYDERLPATTGSRPRASRSSRELGLDEAVLFPNYGLLWERTLHASLPALLANMAAWNRWCATVVQEGAAACIRWRT